MRVCTARRAPRARADRRLLHARSSTTRLPTDGSRRPTHCRTSTQWADAPLTALAIAAFPKDADRSVLSSIFRGGLLTLRGVSRPPRRSSKAPSGRRPSGTPRSRAPSADVRPSRRRRSARWPRRSARRRTGRRRSGVKKSTVCTSARSLVEPVHTRIVRGPIVDRTRSSCGTGKSPSTWASSPAASLLAQPAQAA